MKLKYANQTQREIISLQGRFGFASLVISIV